MRLILASASPRRFDLLARIEVVPDAVVPAQVDESVPNGELPRQHAVRLAVEKAEAVARQEPEALVLAKSRGALLWQVPKGKAAPNRRGQMVRTVDPVV